MKTATEAVRTPTKNITTQRKKLRLNTNRWPARQSRKSSAHDTITEKPCRKASGSAILLISHASIIPGNTRTFVGLFIDKYFVVDLLVIETIVLIGQDVLLERGAFRFLTRPTATSAGAPAPARHETTQPTTALGTVEHLGGKISKTDVAAGPVLCKR